MVDKFYWDAIKGGLRTFSGLSDSRKVTVRAYGESEVANGIITQADFERYIAT